MRSPEQTAVLALLDVMISDKEHDLKSLKRLREAIVSVPSEIRGNAPAPELPRTESTGATHILKPKRGIVSYREDIAKLLDRSPVLSMSQITKEVLFSQPTLYMALRGCPWFERIQLPPEDKRSLWKLTEAGIKRHEANGQPKQEEPAAVAE